MRKRPFAVLIPVAAALAFAAPAGAATSSQEATSENWAGYVASPSTSSDSSGSSSGFSSASGSWTEPKVTCSSGSATYGAFWVGLGGGGQDSEALEQEGTQADCSANGTATYYAWYELVPSAPVKISMTVKPGDTIYARTAVSGDEVTVQVDDKTTGQNFSTTLTMSDATPDTSTAEWIAEAPSECAGGASGQCEPLPLSDFGTVKFSDAYATAAGHTAAMADWSSEAVALDPVSSGAYGYGNGYGGGFGGPDAESSLTGSSSAGAAPGSVSSDGTAFSVQYGADATGDSAGSTATSGTGDGYSGGYGNSSGYGYSGGYGDTSGYGYSGGYGDAGGYGYSGGYGDTSGYGYADGYGDTSGYGSAAGYSSTYGSDGDSGASILSAGSGGYGYLSLSGLSQLISRLI